MGKTQVKSRTEMSTKVGIAVAVVMLAAALATVGPKIASSFAAGVVVSACTDSSESQSRDVPTAIAALSPKHFDPYVKSTAKGGGSSYTDKCLIDVYAGLSSDGKQTWKSTEVASCSSADEDGTTKRNCRLQEAYCTSNKVSNYAFKCAMGCNSGACRVIQSDIFSLESLPTLSALSGSGSTAVATAKFNITVAPTSSDIFLNLDTASSTDSTRFIIDDFDLGGFTVFSKESGARTSASYLPLSYQIPTGMINVGNGVYKVQKNTKVTIPVTYKFQNRYLNSSELLASGNYAVGLTRINYAKELPITPVNRKVVWSLGVLWATNPIKIENVATSTAQFTFVSSSIAAYTTDDLPDGHYGIFTIKYKVKALGGPVYIGNSADIKSSGSTLGKTTVTIDKSGVATTTSGMFATLIDVTDAFSTPQGNYKIEKDTEETFEVVTNVQLPAAGPGLYRAKISGIRWSSSDVLVPENLFIGSLDAYKTSYLNLF